LKKQNSVKLDHVISGKKCILSNPLQIAAVGPNVNMAPHNLPSILSPLVDVHANKVPVVHPVHPEMKGMLVLTVKTALMPKMVEMAMFFAVQSGLNLVSSVHQVHPDQGDNLDPKERRGLREKPEKQVLTAQTERLGC